MSDTENGVDYETLAQGIDQMKEVVTALVESLRTDGFTDREARVIVAGLFAGTIKEE
jgi:hypothetical protein